MTPQEQLQVKEAPLTSEAAKVLLILSVADDHGFRPISWELYHSCACYLKMVKGFNFPGYIFTPFWRPDYGTAFISEELAADIAMLCDRGLLESEDRLTFSITEAGKAAAQQAIPTLAREGKSAYDFRIDAIGALGTTRDFLAKACYQGYIKSLQEVT